MKNLVKYIVKNLVKYYLVKDLVKFCSVKDSVNYSLVKDLVSNRGFSQILLVDDLVN